jgi:dipeptidase E
LKDISFALIENAADPYGDDVGFVLDTRSVLQSLGLRLDLVDLSEYKGQADNLKEKLSTFDVIWFGGGNTYYLRWLMQVTGFDTIVKELLEKGIVYGGGSAGAIAAGKTLKHFDLVDDPNVSPELNYSGLGLTDLIIIPHWGTEKIHEELTAIQNLYKRDNIDAITITDRQAVIVNDEKWEVLP